MGDGIAEMNKARIYTHTDGKVYMLVDKEIRGSCIACSFYVGGLCDLIRNGILEHCEMSFIYKLQTPLATASAELAEHGKPLVAGLQEINKEAIRTFDTGATRDNDEGKHDIEAFFSPLVTKRRAEYMHLHRKLGDGSMREGDNWQLGMPYNECLKSLCRHVEDIKLLSRGYDAREDIETALCAVMFNCESMLLTRLEEKT